MIVLSLLVLMLFVYQIWLFEKMRQHLKNIDSHLGKQK